MRRSLPEVGEGGGHGHWPGGRGWALPAVQPQMEGCPSAGSHLSPSCRTSPAQNQTLSLLSLGFTVSHLVASYW